MTNTSYPLRIARSTTGVVHAARETVEPVLDFTKPAGERETGETRVVIVKACGFDPNTYRRVAGTSSTTAAVTCRKCLAVLAR